MSFVKRDTSMMREPQKSGKNDCCNEKARSTILCPISVTNCRRPLTVEIKLDPGPGRIKVHENMQLENDLLSYDHNLTKLKMVFVDKAGTTTTSSTATLSCPFSSDSTSSLSSPFSFDSEESSLLPSNPDDSYVANKVLDIDCAHTPIQFDAKVHHKIPVETGNCGENIHPSSKESCNLSADFTNDISRTRYFQNLSGYGASLIKLKREIELIQHIQKHSKVVNLELDWRMKRNRRMTSKIPFVDREENMQRLYAKSRIEYRMEGKRRREDIAKKLEERKSDFRTMC